MQIIVLYSSKCIPEMLYDKITDKAFLIVETDCNMLIIAKFSKKKTVPGNILKAMGMHCEAKYIYIYI